MSQDDAWSRELSIGRVGEGRLVFGPPSGPIAGSGYVRVPFRIEIDGLSASSALDLEDPYGGVAGLIGYFADMAASWLGWHGAKDWHDDGGLTNMIATHDGKGTISVRVSTEAEVRGDFPGSWQLQAVVALDPGSLDVYVTAPSSVVASRT